MALRMSPSLSPSLTEIAGNQKLILLINYNHLNQPMGFFRSLQTKKIENMEGRRQVLFQFPLLSPRAPASQATDFVETRSYWNR